MALRTIKSKVDNEEFLRKKSRDVVEITDRIKILLDDMAETMKAADGVGLAAPQVGVLKKVVIVDIGDEHGLIELINPEIIEEEGTAEDEEGCLSLVGIRGIVERPKRVKVKALNRRGEEFIIEGEDLLARALCHEIDHLHGILFVDKVTEYTNAD